MSPSEILGGANQLSYKPLGKIGDYYVCYRLVDMVDLLQVDLNRAGRLFQNLI